MTRRGAVLNLLALALAPLARRFGEIELPTELPSTAGVDVQRDPTIVWASNDNAFVAASDQRFNSALQAIADGAATIQTSGGRGRR